MGTRLSNDQLSSLHRELDFLEYYYFPDIPNGNSKVARSDYLDTLRVLNKGPIADESTRDYVETTKSQLWNDFKKFRNALHVMSYAFGCALGACMYGRIDPFPDILLQLLVIAFFGVFFGAIVEMIVVSYCGCADEKLPWTTKLLIFILVPAAIVWFVYLRT